MGLSVKLDKVCTLVHEFYTNLCHRLSGLVYIHTLRT